MVLDPLVQASTMDTAAVPYIRACVCVRVTCPPEFGSTGHIYQLINCLLSMWMKERNLVKINYSMLNI